MEEKVNLEQRIIQLKLKKKRSSPSWEKYKRD